MKDDNALTIRFKSWERFRIIWLLLWTGEVRLWIRDEENYVIWKEFLDRRKNRSKYDYR